MYLLERDEAEALRCVQSHIIEEDIRSITRLFRQVEYDLLRSHRRRIQVERVVAEELVILRSSLGCSIEFIQVKRSQRLIGLEASFLINRTYLELSREGMFREFRIAIDVSRTHLEAEGPIFRFAYGREDHVATIGVPIGMEQHCSRTGTCAPELAGILAAVRVVQVGLDIRAYGVASGLQRRMEIVVVAF